MSGLPPKADIPALFNNFIGAGQQGGRDGSIDRASRTKIYSQSDLSRFLEWQLGDFCTFQDAVDVDRGSRKILGGRWPIGNESAIVHLERPRMHAGEVPYQAFINDGATKANRDLTGFDEYGHHLLLFSNCEGGTNVDTGCQRQ